MSCGVCSNQRESLEYVDLFKLKLCDGHNLLTVILFKEAYKERVRNQPERKSMACNLETKEIISWLVGGEDGVDGQ